MSAAITLITDKEHSTHKEKEPIKVKVERRTLAKKRWRMRAKDGTDFGFDLEQPLKHGDVIFSTDKNFYQIEQEPEKVLLVDYTGETAKDAAIAWLIGNTHFPAQFTEKGIVTEEDLAILQLFERKHIHFTKCSLVFEPLSAGQGHHHH